MPEKSIHERLDALRDRQDDEAERALQLLYGELPAWFPLPRREHARRIVHLLGNKGFTAEQIAQFVTDEMADKRIVQGAMLSGEFIRAVNELAHIKYALSLSDNECLEMLAGKDAVAGANSAAAYKNRDDYQDKQDFQNIAKELWANNPSATISELENSPKLKAYKAKYKGAHTLRDWLSKIDPRPPEKKTGRPKK